MPLPASFWKITPAPPKMPAPSFFCSATETSTCCVLATYEPDWIMNASAESIAISRIVPGSCAANASSAPSKDAVYSVRKSCAPPSTRLSPLMKPPCPPDAWTVEVSMRNPGESQETSPPSATTASPESRVSSRMGMVVPITTDFMSTT